MFERKASTFLAFSFLLLALLNTAFSISAAISPAITTYKFTTEKITGTFNVINTDVTQGEMTAISNSPYVTVTSEKVFSITPGGSYPVTYEVNLPEDFPPGTTRIFITATKAPDQGGNVGIAVAFNYVIKIEKPYPDKFVEATGPSVEISGKKVTLEVTATNKGSEPIDSAKAKIKIFDSEKNVLDNVESGEKALPLDSATGLKMVWTAPKTGIYPFEALVEFDGFESNVLKGEIRIGEETLEVGDAPLKLQAGSIQQYKIPAKSLWNEPIPASATLKIMRGTEVLVQTAPSATASVPGWSTTDLVVFVDATSLQPALYDATVEITYKDKKATKDLKLQVVSKIGGEPITPPPLQNNTNTTGNQPPPPQPSDNNFTFIAAAIVVVFLGAILFLKGKAGGGGQQQPQSPTQPQGEQFEQYQQPQQPASKDNYSEE